MAATMAQAEEASAVSRRGAATEAATGPEAAEEAGQSPGRSTRTGPRRRDAPARRSGAPSPASPNLGAIASAAAAAAAAASSSSSAAGRRGAQSKGGMVAPTSAALATAAAAAAAGNTGHLGRLPDECWVRIFAHLEASELCTSASTLCSGALALASQPQLWVALLQLDFCASLPQRAMLQAWLMMHDHFHPRQLYIHKKLEHTLDLDAARAEIEQRGEQAREQERRQKRLRILNIILVRVTHLLLCAAGLASAGLLWAKLSGPLEKWSYYAVFAPLMAFEVFLLMTSAVAFSILMLRGSSGWSGIWNRMRGAVRWLILWTSPCEGAAVLVLACAIIPFLACVLEGDIPPILARDPRLRFAPPFAVAWLALLVLAVSLLRKRSFSPACAGSLALLWLPLVSASILLYLKLTIAHHMSFYIVFAPSLGMTSLLLVFVGFLVVASFWLGCRGNRDWTEYATFTLLTLLTVLLPLLGLQLALASRLAGRISDGALFIPLILWLAGLFICAACHVCASLPGALGGPSLGGAGGMPTALGGRTWLEDREYYSDTELLLPPGTASGVV